MTLGDNGIFKKAQEAKRMQITSEAKEKIGTEILTAQMEAQERNEQLEQSQIEDIVSKYGELQSDNDTIILKDNRYEIKLKDIYTGTIATEGSYSQLKAKVALLEQQLSDASLSESQASKELSDLKTTLLGTTVTEDKILKDYKAYKDGELITGTMGNYSGNTVIASTIEKNTDDTTKADISIPSAGYYDTNSKVQVPIETISNLNSGSVNLNGSVFARVWHRQVDNAYVQEFNLTLTNNGKNDVTLNSTVVKPGTSTTVAIGTINWTDKSTQNGLPKYTYSGTGTFSIK